MLFLVDFYLIFTPEVRELADVDWEMNFEEIWKLEIETYASAGRCKHHQAQVGMMILVPVESTTSVTAQQKMRHHLNLWD